ncbi:MAG TPA: class I SAM-dependent methyltransferase, partial [Spirochaetota bacterium]|nr:class I SAM-dependent methyltransferase [Spirochaetota bacterium]
EVTGIDFSRNSLDYAVKKANENSLKIDYIHDNYLYYSSDRKFDLITMIMCDFTALSPLQRKNLLLKFHGLLKPGGSVLLDVYTLAWFNSKKEQAVYGFNSMNGFWSRDDYYCFLNTFRYENEKVLLDKYTVYTAKEKKQIFNWAQCYDREEIADEFERSGLRIVEFLGDVSGTEYDADADEFALVARKK